MNNRFVFFLFFSILALITMNNTLPLSAAPYIVGELGGSNDIAFYTVTFYSIGNALGVPIGRRSIGRVRMSSFFFFPLIFFAVLSLMAAWAPNYSFFLVVRLLQGMCAGMFFPVISALFGCIEPEASKERKDQVSYTIVTIFTVIPALAAACGGWVAYDYQWQWLFYINVPLFILLAVFLRAQLRRFEKVLEKAPFDVVGYLFYVMSILTLSLAVTLGQQLDWFRSPLITTLVLIGSGALIFFVLWSLQHPYPILDFRLLKNVVFSFALFQLVFLFSSYFGMVILLALWLNLWVNYTPIWTGLIIGTMAFAGFFPRILLSKGYERFDCRIPLALSILLLAYSCLHTTYFNVDINFGRIAFSRILAGFGLAFFLAPIFRLCFHTFSAEKNAAVIGFFQVTRVLASGLGAAFYVTLWQRRQAFFHERLGSQLTPFSKETGEYFAKAEAFGLTEGQATVELGDLLDRQSIALALDDCFYLMCWILTGLFVVVVVTYLFRCKGFKPENLKENS